MISSSHKQYGTSFKLIGSQGLVHFIGFASVDFYMPLCQFRIFDHKRAILEDLIIHTQNPVEHRLLHFDSLFN